MQFSTYNIVYLITNFFTIFVIQRFFNSFFSKHNCRVLFRIGLYFLYFLATSYAFLFWNIPLVNLLTTLMTLFFISLTYEATMQKRLLYIAYILIFMSIPELMVAAATGYTHFTLLQAGDYSNSLSLVISWLLKYICALLIRNYQSMKNKQTTGWVSWASSILIPVATLSQELILNSCKDLTVPKVVASVTLLLVVNVAFFYLYDLLSESYIRRSKVSLLEKENELYNKQCEIMQSSTEDLQAFRHDTKNQLIALAELLKAKEYETAEEQLRSLYDLAQAKIIYSMSGNVIIDGLINYKLQMAVKNNIRIKTEIAVPVQLPIDTADLIAVIGNLLDNAMTALLKLEDSERTLKLKVVYSQQRLLIRSANPYNEDLNIENGKITTTKSDRHMHGYGLANIARAVEKYDGYMEIDTEDHLFIVDIIMYASK